MRVMAVLKATGRESGARACAAQWSSGAGVG